LVNKYLNELMNFYAYNIMGNWHFYSKVSLLQRRQHVKERILFRKNFSIILAPKSGHIKASKENNLRNKHLTVLGTYKQNWALHHTDIQVQHYFTFFSSIWNSVFLFYHFYIYWNVYRLFEPPEPPYSEQNLFYPLVLWFCWRENIKRK
jgi:hypothetical protein